MYVFIFRAQRASNENKLSMCTQLIRHPMKKRSREKNEDFQVPSSKLGGSKIKRKTKARIRSESHRPQSFSIWNFYVLIEFFSKQAAMAMGREAGAGTDWETRRRRRRQRQAHTRATQEGCGMLPHTLSPFTGHCVKGWIFNIISKKS